MGCRKRAGRDGLLRFTLDDESGVALDYAAAKPGRGAWICPSAQCLERAITRGGFSRSFKKAVGCARVGEMRTGVEAALAAEAEKYYASGGTARGARAQRALAQWRGM